jgi:hypothetical protein
MLIMSDIQMLIAEEINLEDYYKENQTIFSVSV